MRDEEQWAEMEKYFKENIPNMKPADFTEMFLIAYRDDAWRISEEFKVELSKLVPVHIKQFKGNILGESMELLHEYNLLTDYLLLDVYYPILRASGGRIAREGGLGMVLRVLRAVNHDEVLAGPLK